MHGGSIFALLALFLALPLLSAGSNSQTAPYLDEGLAELSAGDLSHFPDIATFPNATQAFFWARTDSTQLIFSVLASDSGGEGAVLYFSPTTLPSASMVDALYMLALPAVNVSFVDADGVWHTMPTAGPEGGLLPGVWYNLTLVDGSSYSLVSTGAAGAVGNCSAPDSPRVAALAVTLGPHVYLDGGDGIECFYYAAGFVGSCATSGNASQPEPCLFPQAQTGQFWFLSLQLPAVDAGLGLGLGSNASVAAELLVQQQHHLTGFARYQSLIVWVIVGLAAVSVLLTAYAIYAVTDGCGCRHSPPASTRTRPL
jgi:hypothetical protein